MDETALRGIMREELRTFRDELSALAAKVATKDDSKTSATQDDLKARFHAWMKSQPGFRAAWHAHASKTDRLMSISVWDDMASLLAMKDRPFPGGPLGITPDRVDVFDEVEAF